MSCLILPDSSAFPFNPWIDCMCSGTVQYQRLRGHISIAYRATSVQLHSLLKQQSVEAVLKTVSQQRVEHQLVTLT